MSDTTVWMIEDGTLCLGKCAGRLARKCFTDPQALKFETKKEAETALLDFRLTHDWPWLRTAFVADHMFIVSSPSSTSSINAEDRKEK